ncbi:MAG: hypothetical protein IT423_06460 [Pirellulaceae bacterium]|nr:hypothetical protein [Pirellulaceae bacterium]
MGETFRGGNSRTLAKQLDLLAWPVVVLDQKQQIVFASAALCELMHVDATRLVGLICQPALTADNSLEPQLAMMLAPPSEVLHGRAAVREVPWPPRSPTGTAGQAFLPLIDEDPSSGLILVLFGDSQVLRERLGPLAPPAAPSGTAGDEVLLRIRSQWQQLDGLWPLLGVSPAIELAMRRAQLAANSAAGVLIVGPAGSGKSDVARSIAALRARGLEVPANLIQRLPIECSLIDEQSAASQLETLAARMRPGTPAQATHLILDRIDCLSGPAIKVLREWLTDHAGSLCVVATSQTPSHALSEHSIGLMQWVQSFSTIEIEITPLSVRREDVPALAQHHLAMAAARAGRRLPGIAPATLELMQAYPWPGNASEVQQAATEMLTNAVLTATIQPSHLPLQVRTFAGTFTHSQQPVLEPISMDDVLLDLERIMLERAIKASPRNRARAARLLGISRPRFLRRIAQLGLDDKVTSDEEE